MPPMEARLWNALRELRSLGYHFRRQVPLGHHFADFACHQRCLVVEVDGDTHTSARYDRERDQFMQSEGYFVLRVTNDDVRDHLDAVMKCILHQLESTDRSTSSPSPRWGGIKGGVEQRTPDPEDLG